MPGADSKPSGCNPSNKTLASIGVFTLVAVVFAGWFAWSHWEANPLSREEGKAPKPPKLVELSREAVLDLIPAIGARGIPESASLPQDVAESVKAVEIPLADPVSVAGLASEQDPQVEKWLRHWQDMLPTGKRLTENDRTRLVEILNSSPMDFQSLFRVGTAFRELTGDLLATSIFYSAAVKRADRELLSLAPGTIEAQPILIAMNDARRPLWDVVDKVDRNDRRSLETLVTINADLVKWVAIGDPVLEDARRHAMIGVPECIYALGDAERAVPLLMALDTSGMTENEKLGVAWIRALALMQVRRRDDAVKQFRFVAQDSSYQYAESANILLAETLSLMGRSADADIQFKVCAARYHMSDSDTLQLANAMTKPGQSPVAK